MTDWHVPAELLDRYLSGALDPVQVMSVDAHLARCGPCRTAVPPDEEWLAASWERVADEVVRPRQSLAERASRRLGVPEHLARVLVATPTLSRAWLAALAVTLGFGVAAAHLAPGGLLAFLTLAPVLPPAGIALAYGPWADPAHESYAATPMAGAPLLLLRSVAALVTALVLTGLAVPLLPVMTPMSAAWLLPALALTSGALALGTRLPLPVAAAGLAACWVGVVTAVGAATGDRSLPFQPGAQVAYGCAAALLALVLYLRRHHLDPGEPR